MAKILCCKDCPNRFVRFDENGNPQRCHSTCQKYQEESAAHAAERERIKKMVAANNDVEDYVVCEKEKNRKINRSKRRIRYGRR